MPSDQLHNLNKLQSYSLPTSSYIDLTLGTTGSTYTAPADGWFLFNRKITSSQWQYVAMANDTTHIGTRCMSNVSNAGVFIPVRKGDIVEANYNANGTINYFRFIYAAGSEPQS